VEVESPAIVIFGQEEICLLEAHSFSRDGRFEPHLASRLKVSPEHHSDMLTTGH
jgi:hypothetical protein